MKLARSVFIPVLFFIEISFMCAMSRAEDTSKYLSKFVKDPTPWLHIAANSEQRQPLYLGATPREIALRLPPADSGQPILYEVLRLRGEAQARQIKDVLVKNGVITKSDPMEFEMWPARDDYGQLTWVFARWRSGRLKPWQRLNSSILSENPDPYLARWPILPVSLNPAKKEDFSLIFDDFLTLKSLYDKPLFGDCIWATDDGIALDAWLSIDQREAMGKEVADDIKRMGSSLICRVLPQPARLNGKPITFIVGMEGDNLIWPKNIKWKKEELALPESRSEGRIVNEWPKDFSDRYREDVIILAGEKEAVFPLSKREVLFKNKNCADKNNQLQELVAYLEERYKELGLKTWRQDFYWRGIKQSNLIAVIPGSDPSLRPVLMADHIDTAFCEDIFRDSGKLKRISAPGADDNCSATAALLRSAPILQGLKLRREVWLVHLTGEEFPADDLGARYFVSQLLKERQDIEGLVLLDMIGYREKDDSIFQINPGDSPGSLRMARAALDAAKGVTELKPVLRTRFDEKSYLYNTDGLIFSDAGFPVVYLNEHMHKLENMYRKGYHHSTDTSKDIDWNYASGISKVAIEVVAVLAASAPVEQVPTAQNDWSVIFYSGADDPKMTKAYNARFKEMTESVLPDNIEILMERDTDWPDGSTRAIRSSDSYEEFALAEKDSASPQTLYNFLKWAGPNAKGKYRLLVIQGHSFGWRGIIEDKAVPGDRNKSNMMSLREMAAAIKASGLQPDVILFDSCAVGNAEPIEEFKALAPYLVVSQRRVPYSGLSAEKIFKMAGKPNTDPAAMAKRIPEEYVKEYAHDGAMIERENEYPIVTMAAIDTAKWGSFADKFKELTKALSASGFMQKLIAQPGWITAFADSDTNADLVEFLNRLPLLIDDPAVKSLAAGMLDDIGYPDRIAAENAATVTLDPEKVRSFELRVEACPRLQQGKALEEIKIAWKDLNQDLGLPDTLTYDISEFRESRQTKREFIVRCPDGALKKPVTFRPWLAGAKYAVLTTVDTAGQVSTRKFFREKDYIAVSDFPDTSFLISEAHTQGAPFIHGIGLVLNPGMKPDFESSLDPSSGLSGGSFYKTTAWNKRTGWGDLMLDESFEPISAAHTHR